MADNWSVTRLKKIGNAVVEKAGAALVIYVILNIGGVGGLIAVALRGNPHSPWFYAAAGAVIFSAFAVLVMAILVIIQLSRKRGTVGVQEIGESRFAEMEFVYGRAKEQAQQIQRVVKVEDLSVVPAGLLRSNDPYIEFNVTLWNHSIYDVELVDNLVGFIGLNTWEFRKPVTWVPQTKPRTVWANNPAGYTLRQDLTPEDVQRIRTMRAHFTMGLELMVKGYDAAASLVPAQPIPWGTPPTNESLVKSFGDD
jgi:hypothetical protein